MSRSCGLTALILLLAVSLLGDTQSGDNQALWQEYGLAHTDTIHRGNLTVTAYRMKDPTGAIAAWEWLRSAKARSCDLAPFCSNEGNRTTITSSNYVLVFRGGNPHKSDVESIVSGLPDRHDSMLPPILGFLPRTDLVPGSARYLLGTASVDAFAPELKQMNLNFNEGAEGQIASYKVADGHQVRLVLLDYPTPDMARTHAAAAEKLFGPSVKRSGVLVGIVLPPATQEQASAVLGKVQYEAKIVWNDEPGPNPIKPLYQLLVSVIQISCLLAALCTAAGLCYAGMRIYRRRYGSLEEQESMTTLHLTGE